MAILIYSGVRQHVGWAQVAYYILSSDKIERDSLSQQMIKQIITQDAIDKYIKSQDGVSSQAFDTAALILSSVSIFLVIVTLMLFKEYDNLKDYKVQMEAIFEEYKSRFKVEVNAVKIQLDNLERQATQHKELLDAMPIVESADFEAILDLGNKLEKKKIINEDDYESLKLTYYLNLLNPLSYKSHGMALSQILQIIQILKPSEFVSETVDEKLKMLISQTRDKEVMDLAFRVQKALHLRHSST